MACLGQAEHTEGACGSGDMGYPDIHVGAPLYGDPPTKGIAFPSERCGTRTRRRQTPVWPLKLEIPLDGISSCRKVCNLHTNCFRGSETGFPSPKLRWTPPECDFPRKMSLQRTCKLYQIWKWKFEKTPGRKEWKITVFQETPWGFGGRLGLAGYAEWKGERVGNRPNGL